MRPCAIRATRLRFKHSCCAAQISIEDFLSAAGACAILLQLPTENPLWIAMKEKVPSSHLSSVFAFFEIERFSEKRAPRRNHRLQQLTAMLSFSREVAMSPEQPLCLTAGVLRVEAVGGNNGTNLSENRDPAHAALLSSLPSETFVLRDVVLAVSDIRVHGPANAVGSQADRMQSSFTHDQTHLQRPSYLKTNCCTLCLSCPMSQQQNLAAGRDRE
jgi:hypothetical protein